MVADQHGVIYVIGGGGSNLAATYDAIADAWTQLPTMPTARYLLGTALGRDNRIYAYGGSPGHGSDTVTEVYDPSTHAWITAAMMNINRAAMGYAADLSGRIYAIGGATNFNTAAEQYLDSVETYQPSLLLGSGDSIASQEGTPFSGEVGTFKDLGPTEPAVNYTASINWGDGNSTAASVAAGQNSGEFVVSSSHTYAVQGSYTTTIEINDADGDTVTYKGSADISNAPITGNAININASTGVQFSGLIGHFSDANPLTKAGDYLASLTWGDLSSSAATVSASALDGFDISSTHTYSTPGLYTFKIELFDGGQTVYFTGTATVTAPPPVITPMVISATEGTLFSGKVATFTDADASLTAPSFSGTVEWGDGSVTPAFIAANGTGGFDVSGNYTYHHFGGYAVKVVLGVTGGSSSNATGVANVSDAAITATGYDLVCKGTNFSNTVATFVDANPFGILGEYKATILWGDGKSSTGKVQVAGSGYKVTGSHSYLKRGKYSVSVTIGDRGTSTASATTHINAGPVK